MSWRLRSTALASCAIRWCGSASAGHTTLVYQSGALNHAPSPLAGEGWNGGEGGPYRWHRGAVMGEQIERLAQFVAETQWDEIPAAVQQHARLVLLDTLGVILAGAEQPEVQQLRQRLLATAGTGATVLARGWPSSDPRTAALLNGIAGRSIELCEGHRYVSCQGAVQIVPGVLAVGEWAQSTGREMLTALIVGYDAAVRLGPALTPRALAMQNGQAAGRGAGAVGARTGGLNPAQTRRAIRI